MLKKKLDVIIPFKDAEDFLPNICSDLINQCDKNFEVFFVSDNSTDNSISFLSQTFPFKHTLIKSNGDGPGTARNLGMELSSNHYVLFIDADDRIKNNYISSFNIEIENDGPDIIECMYHSINTEGEIISGTNLELFIANDDRFHSFLDGSIPRLSWGKAFKREHLVKNCAKFPDGIHNGEDHIFLLKAYSNDPKISIIPIHLYDWVRNPHSLTNRTCTHKTVEDFIKVSELKKVILEESLRKISTEIHSEIILKFSRRTFKEARVLKSKILEENIDSEILIKAMQSLLLESNELKEVISIIKNDKTSYWSDVM